MSSKNMVTLNLQSGLSNSVQQVNCEDKEVKVLNEKELAEYRNYVDVYGISNVYFDVNAIQNREIKKDKQPYTKPTGIVLCPKIY